MPYSTFSLRVFCCCLWKGTEAKALLGTPGHHTQNSCLGGASFFDQAWTVLREWYHAFSLLQAQTSLQSSHLEEQWIGILCHGPWWRLCPLYRALWILFGFRISGMFFLIRGLHTWCKVPSIKPKQLSTAPLLFLQMASWYSCNLCMTISWSKYFNLSPNFAYSIVTPWFMMYEHDVLGTPNWTSTWFKVEGKWNLYRTINKQTSEEKTIPFSILKKRGHLKQVIKCPI